jgi:hypothetical protein
LLFEIDPFAASQNVLVGQAQDPGLGVVIMA